MGKCKNNRLIELTPRHLPVMNVSVDVLAEIIDTVGSRKAETGGALGREEGGQLITHYHFDKGSQNTAATYSPDYKSLNLLFEQNWNPQGIRLTGFVHSHPGCMSRPSCGDAIYAERILKAIPDLKWLWLPIVITVPDSGDFKLIPWVIYPAKQGVEVVRAKIKVAKSVKTGANKIFVAISEFVDQILDEIVISGKALVEAADELKVQAPVVVVENPVADETFDRVKDAYDLELMAASRIICVGAGGAASWIEELTRAGIEQFVLIDPDKVSETNLATQQTYRADIGRPKVDCLIERIHSINPAAKVVALQKYLDEISDEEMASLAADAIEGKYPRQTVICGLTDNFYAQARTNRLSLNFGLASLCGQVYREGRGAEITFTYPGITPACHRCALSSRYKYFLAGNSNPTGSHGTPIFATTRLNAIKGFILLAILHHNSNHPRWGDMLKRIDNRNLIQVRIDPDFSETMGIQVFDKVFEKADQQRIFFDETIWLPQEQECPKTGYAVCCPDCKGTGNLLDAIGTFEDTRILRPYPQVQFPLRLAA